MFCNPEEWPDLLFLVTPDHYVIPVWPRKAIYWYHVGNDVDRSNNGVIAGINEDLEIVNRSDDEWVVSYKDKERFLSKGRSIEAKDGEVITIFNKKFSVVRGDSERQFFADLEIKPDEKQKTGVEVEVDDETENKAVVESEPEKIPEVEVETDTIVDTEDETEVKAVLVVSEKNVSEDNTEDIVEDEVGRKTGEGIQLICSDVKSSTIPIE